MSDETSGSNATIRIGAVALLRCTARDCRSSGERCSPRLDGARRSGSIAIGSRKDQIFGDLPWVISGHCSAESEEPAGKARTGGEGKGAKM